MKFVVPTDNEWWNTHALALTGPRAVLVSRNDNGFVHSYPRQNNFLPQFSYQFDEDGLRYLFTVSKNEGKQALLTSVGRCKEFGLLHLNYSGYGALQQRDDNLQLTWIDRFVDAPKIWEEKFGFAWRADVPLKQFSQKGYTLFELVGTRMPVGVMAPELREMQQMDRSIAASITAFPNKRCHSNKLMGMEF